MKKVFLSLAALAFVATGAVSCSSDDGGSPAPQDDNVTPQDDNTPVESNGVLTYDGQEISLDNMYFLINGANEQVQLVNVGTEEAPEIVSYWVGVAHDTDDVQTAPNYYQFSFYLPTEETTEGYSLLYPNEVATEDIMLDGVYAEVNGQQVDLTAVDAGSVVFNTFVYGQDVTSETSNESSFGTQEAAVISHTYDAEFEGIGLQSLLDSSSVSSASSSRNFRSIAKGATIYSVEQMKNMSITVK